MNKKRLFKIFLRSLIRSLFMMGLMFMVGYGSFKLTMMFYKEKSPGDSAADKLIKDMITDVEVEDVSKNLIYMVDDETGAIKGMVIEVCNTLTNNLDYITIPKDAQFAMSNELYQTIYKSNPEVPQILRLSQLNKYFDKERVYKYGMIMVQDIIGVKLSYYTVMESTMYKKVFTTQKKTVTYERLDKQETEKIDDNKVSTTMNIWILHGDFMKEALSKENTDQRKDFIKDIYKSIESNLSVKNKLKYLDSYEKINSDYIYYHGICGEENGAGFTVAMEESKKQIEKILANKTYSMAQKDASEETEVSSVGYNIEILNGSNITGLAATYQNALQDKGYTITSIGNYEQSVLSKTKIIVKEEGVGEDLRGYFNDPELEVGQLKDGVDIQIILGVADRAQ